MKKFKKFKNLERTASLIAARVLNDARRAGKTKRTHDSTGLRRIALKMLREAGVPYDPKASPYGRGVHWDGNTVAVQGETGSSILHELAHNQCSAPADRELPEFGLGVGPSGDHEKAHAVYKVRENRRSIDDQEIRASMLGILWERYHASDFWVTLHEHCWLSTDEEDQLIWDQDDEDALLQWLLAHNLIDGHGKPLLNFRMTDD